MPRPKRPHATTLDEVSITRQGDAAIIGYSDRAVATTHLTLGPRLGEMSDQDILDCHNEIIATQERMRAEYPHEALEIPRGKPQVSYDARCDQWVPRGFVLRCLIHDSGPDYEATIEIDDREFSLREFGRMLTTFAGWGMRVTFVPDGRLEQEPEIVVGEPEQE